MPKVTQIHVLGSMMILVFVWNAYRNLVPEKQESTPQTHSLSEFTGSSITANDINAFTGLNVHTSEIGLPIRMEGTSTWLIPLGSWTSTLSAISVQGKWIDKVNPFAGLPMREERTRFIGPFKGAITFNEENQRFNWLQKDTMMETITYVRSRTKHFIFEKETENAVHLIDVESAESIAVNRNNSVEAWAILAETDSVIVVESESGNLVLSQIPLPYLYKTQTAE